MPWYTLPTLAFEINHVLSKHKLLNSSSDVIFSIFSIFFSKKKWSTLHFIFIYWWGKRIGFNNILLCYSAAVRHKMNGKEWSWKHLLFCIIGIVDGFIVFSVSFHDTRKHKINCFLHTFTFDCGESSIFTIHSDSACLYSVCCMRGWSVIQYFYGTKRTEPMTMWRNVSNK